MIVKGGDSWNYKCSFTKGDNFMIAKEDKSQNYKYILTNFCRKQLKFSTLLM